MSLDLDAIRRQCEKDTMPLKHRLSIRRLLAEVDRLRAEFGLDDGRAILDTLIHTDAGDACPRCGWLIDTAVPTTRPEPAFIAHAREDVPDLAAEVKRLRAEVKALRTHEYFQTHNGGLRCGQCGEARDHENHADSTEADHA